MNKNVLCIITFGAGAAIGAGTAWYITKRSFEARTDEEIESVRQAYEKRYKKLEEDLYKSDGESSVLINPEPKQEPVKREEKVVKKAAEKPNIIDYRSYYEGSEDKATLEPEIINENEYGENPNYRKVELTHTADGYLLDEDGEPIDDESGIVGYTSEEIEDQYIESGEDVVYIRNDDREVYYEVLRSEKFYDEGDEL